ncbi:hypothetical protein ABEB36_003071 [Hypothenemus hampei]
MPSKGSGEYKVCPTCFSQLTSNSDGKQPIVLPDRFLRRLENLENPSAPPITVYRQDPKISALKSGLSAADQELVERLEKLKEKPEVPPSDSEIRARLAKLKGITTNSDLKSAFYTTDNRSDQEKINSLLSEYTELQNINIKHEDNTDLATRLAAVKGEEYKSKSSEEYEDLDSEEEIDQITKRIISEVSLDERCPIGSSRMAYEDDDDDKDIRSSSPELPWCVLCNNDAVYRCLDCGGDLYCRSCNTEVHRNSDDMDHRVVSYK